MRLIVIDNYDSFTFNIVQLFFEFDLEVSVFRNDRVTLDGIDSLRPDWICISPGPRSPAHSGISKAVVERFGPTIPILGVCLGMQVINEVFGGRTIKAPIPVHGKCSRVAHEGRSVFRGMPSPFWAARYHSLCVELQSDCLLPLAHAEDGVLMGIRHRSWPLCGVQFHPESFMTEHGPELIRNFLSLRRGWIAPDDASGPDRFPRIDTPIGYPDRREEAA